jgi:hypothetical protein
LSVPKSLSQLRQSFTFTTAENAQAGCRFGQDTVSCNQFLGETAARAALKEVETKRAIRSVFSQLSYRCTVYSTASVYNDFTIPGPPDGNLIDVQITVQYDFFGNFASGGLYTLNNSLALRVQDRTANALVARHELASMERQGDQGFTDASLAQERSVLTGEVGHFIVKLRRGHHYRLHFELESSAVSFLAELCAPMPSPSGIGSQSMSAKTKWSYWKRTIRKSKPCFSGSKNLCWVRSQSMTGISRPSWQSSKTS